MADPAPPSILVVDDTVENLTLLAGMLGAHGYDVRPVTSGHDAIQAIEADPPDAVLMDVTMPGMNGFETCRAIKANAAWRDIPIIFLTALTDVSDKLEGFAAGGVDFVTKPFQLDEVRTRVEVHVSLRRARQALAEQLARLQSLERLRDDLVHMIVHDMRTPLTVMLMNLSMARDGLEGDSAAMVGDAFGAADMLKHMADALLDVSRMEAGKMPIVSERCDLSAIALEVQRSLTAMDATRMIELDAPQPVMVTCDGGLIRRVMENLVSNGIKHTPSGSPVRMVVSTNGPRARFTVEDSGRGVPPEARERIFEKFGALAQRENRSYHSAGLGLAFCKLAVEAHGGAIHVEARQPQGSAFIFEIPS